MPRAEIDGIGIDYELIGTGRAVSITPGGRFSKDDPGVRELAQALAAGGLRALIWDRPNCGASDLAFRGDSESDLNADILAGLIRKLDLGPTILAGGSAGSRVSLRAATRHPGTAAGLFLWWITGGGDRPVRPGRRVLRRCGADGGRRRHGGGRGDALVARAAYAQSR